MVYQEPIIWGIHAGRHGEADSLFLEKNCIAIGLAGVGDLSALPADREAIRAKLVATYPGHKPMRVTLAAGMLFRFLREMKSGDLLVYPSKKDRQIHLGIVEGDYKFDPNKNSDYPHMRPVKWWQAVPRTNFTQEALYELRSALALFRVRGYAEEFRAAMEGKPLFPSDEDETDAVLVKEIEGNNRDFIIQQLAQELEGHSLAALVANLLITMGYRSQCFPNGPD